ncbi:unnamed protein product [Vitrella brassicaformis CCMP3155]|uniref:Clusterin-associated protein 1 n=1 Tax=Vitrella brassicaformis (strain CCMP3155) TaxID=1169540 RepID=A0A0G4EHP2_VITBC|nr:unnamed protein product [Vitrella brassicaformis CCMP3155]|eukprot:CEL96007.1 unnamed protein product [Vitrella brassicaformis CCMP3155]
MALIAVSARREYEISPKRLAIPPSISFPEKLPRCSHVIPSFVEYLRHLGYPRLISLDNFRTPNFELVADIMDWLCHRLDPTVNIPDDITDEPHRIEFVKKICEVVAVKTRIKMNPKRLYGADMYAVKEMVKVARMLYEGMRAVTDTSNPSQPAGSLSGSTEAPPDHLLAGKLADLKAAKALSSQIVESGARLHDLLGRDGDNREAREKALAFLDSISRNLDSTTERDFIEKSIKRMMRSDTDSLEQMKSMCAALEKDEARLRSQIKKKQADVERAEKRLQNMAGVRPAFLEEYERHERELRHYYGLYVDRQRNLDHLEHELDEMNRQEQLRMDENERRMKKMQKRLREEEWRLLRGETEINANEPLFDQDESIDEDHPSMAAAAMNAERPRRPAPRERGGRQGEVIGSMYGEESDESDEADEDDDIDEQHTGGGLAARRPPYESTEEEDEEEDDLLDEDEGESDDVPVQGGDRRGMRPVRPGGGGVGGGIDDHDEDEEDDDVL